MKRSIETKIRDEARGRIKIKITGRVRSPRGFDVVFPDRGCPDGHDIIRVSTKAEALSLLLIKATITPKLHFKIQAVSRKDEQVFTKVPWCRDCRKYHEVPDTREKHEEIGCRMRWRELDTSK